MFITGNHVRSAGLRYNGWARVVYALMRHGVGYVKQSQEAYAEHTRAKVEKQFHRRAKELGYEVRKIEPPPAPTSGTAVT